MLCIITDLEPLRNHSVELGVLYEGLVDVPDHDVAAEETLPRYQVVQLGLGLVQLAPAAAGHTHALTGAPLGPGQRVHQGQHLLQLLLTGRREVRDNGVRQAVGVELVRAGEDVERSGQQQVTTNCTPVTRPAENS